MKELPPKRKFEFEGWEGLCDIYVNDYKIIAGHRANKGHIYLHIPEDVDVKVEAKPCDPRVGIQAEITPDGVVPFKKDNF